MSRERAGKSPWQHPWWQHLRLRFNVLLSPIYLWGVLLADGRLADGDVWLGYVALHLFLYGGTTAFNSYYDRDEGPVGGLLHPPPVDRGLLGFSLVFQALGLPLAVLVNGSFSLAWLVLFVVAAAYSHPAVRLKSHPLGALAAVALGQGAVGFAAGWLVVAPTLATLSAPAAVVGQLTTALIVTGLYIVTQSYQTAEDRARGDRTLPVLLGPGRALRLAVAILAAGGTMMLVEIGRRYGPLDAALLGTLFVLVGLYVVRWSYRFDETDVARNYRTAMQVATVSSAGLSAYLVWQLL